MSVPSFYNDGCDGKMVQSSIILPPFIEHWQYVWQGAKGCVRILPKVAPVWLEIETHVVKELASSNEHK